MASWGLGAVFEIEIVEQRPGFTALRVTGPKAAKIFENESGGHRWQRVPPSEKRDRVHTSTVTVAVMPEPTEVQVPINERDLEWSACRGSGAGGQHRNQTASAVQLRHVPSNLMVRCEAERSQFQNKQTALAILRAKLHRTEQERQSKASADNRKQQVGSGQRGDKRRTIREQDGSVVDHVTGKRWEFKRYARGDWE